MEYAQARMQARHGSRPSEAQWRQLGEQRELAAYLAAARALPFADWVAGIGDTAGPHEIERALRRRWRRSVGELARWLPPEWHAAVDWVAHLIDLPVRVHLARGGGMPSWADEDAALADGRADDELARWVAEWVRRWPADEDDEARTLNTLRRQIAAHLGDFAGLDPGRAWEARRDLGLRMTHAFREFAFRPTAAFAYLLLVALDLERLRGELVVRALQRRRRS